MYGARLIPLGGSDGKKPLAPWRKTRIEFSEIERLLFMGSGIGIVPASIGAHVLDIDSGSSDRFENLIESISPAVVCQSISRFEGRRGVGDGGGWHVWLKCGDAHPNAGRQTLDGLELDERCANGYVALSDEALGRLTGFIAMNGFRDETPYSEIAGRLSRKAILTGKGGVRKSPVQRNVSPDRARRHARDYGLGSMRDGHGRNHVLFDRCRKWARRNIAKFKNRSEFSDRLESVAFAIDAKFGERQVASRVRWTCENVAEFIWARRKNPFPSSDVREQRRRGLSSGVARRKRRDARRRDARELKAQGLAVAEIASRVNVSVRTVYRYLTKQSASLTRTFTGGEGTGAETVVSAFDDLSKMIDERRGRPSREVLAVRTSGIGMIRARGTPIDGLNLREMSEH